MHNDDYIVSVTDKAGCVVLSCVNQHRIHRACTRGKSTRSAQRDESLADFGMTGTFSA